MLKPNNENSNRQLSATQKSPSNTPLNERVTLSLSINSFKPDSLPKYDSHFIIKVLCIHLDYLRVSGSDLSKKSFNELKEYLFPEVETKNINKPWHPDPCMSKSKKYQNIIVSKAGIALGWTQKAKYKGKNIRYCYDIMIDFTGAYFANLSLLEQQELVYHLNDNWKLKCHRLDVAMDDYSRKLFPVGRMISAFLENNHYGFKFIDDSYTDIIDNKLVGTLGLGSRRSSFFVRIYNKHKNFVRWETELKKKKAQKLFDKLAKISKDKNEYSKFAKDIQDALIDTAIGKIDFRDNRIFVNHKYARRDRSERLLFWQVFLDKLHSNSDTYANNSHLNITSI